MRRTLTTLLALHLLAVPGVAAQGHPAAAALDRYFSRAARFGFSGAIGLAVDGEVVLRRGYGLADRRTGQPVTPTTIFALASLNKQFVGAGILALIEDGRLALSDTLGQFFPTAPAHVSRIPIEHVLQHRAGFGDPYRDAYRRLSYGQYVDSMLALVPDRGPTPRPMSYANLSYVVLTEIIARVTGGDPEAFLRERLWDRAGLQRTGRHLVRWPADSMAHYQEPMIDHNWGMPIEVLELPLTRPGYLTDNLTLSTVDDLLRWDAALRGDAVFSAASRKLMTAGSDSIGYAFGWRLERGPGGATFQVHGGYDDALGVAVTMARLPDTPFAVVILSNTIINETTDSDFLVHAIVDALNGGTPPMPPPPGDEAVPGLDGAWQAPGGGRFTITRDPGGIRIVADDETAALQLQYPGVWAPDGSVPRADTLEGFLRAMAGGEDHPALATTWASVDREAFRARHVAMMRDAAGRFGPFVGAYAVGEERRPDYGETWRYRVLRFERGALFYRRVVVDSTGLWVGRRQEVASPVELTGQPDGSGGLVTWDFRLGRVPVRLRPAGAGRIALLGDGGELIVRRAALP